MHTHTHTHTHTYICLHSSSTRTNKTKHSTSSSYLWVNQLEGNRGHLHYLSICLEQMLLKHKNLLCQHTVKCESKELLTQGKCEGLLLIHKIFLRSGPKAKLGKEEVQGAVKV